MLSFDGDDQQRILYDIAGGVSVADSKLTYSQDMLDWREKIEQWWEEQKEENPDAELAVPNEIPGDSEANPPSSTQTAVDHHTKMAQMHEKMAIQRRKKR